MTFEGSGRPLTCADIERVCLELELQLVHADYPRGSGTEDVGWWAVSVLGMRGDFYVRNEGELWAKLRSWKARDAARLLERGAELRAYRR